VLAASVVPAVYALPAHAQGPAQALEEVVVSAQRREQSLQDVPISIAAFSNAAIQNFRIQNLTDLNTLVPNMSAVEGAGGTRSVVFQIRGLYATGTALGADAGVATYLDGVYLRGGGASIVNYADLERIEVLRGPQGTLFGRNTSGGAIAFITKDPAGEFGFRQKLTTGNFDLFESRTRVDTPQLGPLSASLNYSYSDREGPVENTGAGFAVDFAEFGGGSFVSPDRLGDSKTEAVFLAVDADFHEDLSLLYKFDYTDMEATPTAVGILGSIPTLAGLTGPSFGAEMPDSVNNAYHLPTTQLTRGHNLTAEYALNDSMTLRNILSYREASVQAPGHTLDGLGQFAPIVVIFAVTGENEREEFSEELQFIWDETAFTLTTGVMFYDLDQTAGGYKNAQNGFFGSAPPNLTFFPGSVPATQSDVEAQSMAAYGQLEYHLNEQWDVILGGRYTKDEKDYVDHTLMTGEVLETAYDESEFTYLLGLNYQPTLDSLVYSKYSTGYISGGIVSGLPYELEKSKSFELGAKASWLENRLQTNAAWFFVQYENQQFGTAGNLIDPPIPTSQVLVNAGETEAQGIEFEGSWLPFTGLTMGLNLGYLDFEFKEIDLVLLGGPISKHLRPKWTSTVSADYETLSVIGDARLQFHFDASYRSEEEIITRPVPFVDGTNPGTWRLNASVSLGGMEFAGGQLGVSFWGRNLTDKNLPSNMNTLGPIVAGYYEFPRTYGVDLTYDY
tara:strand:+ start:26325 stop:28517 length:2193 start_codon:yes stop_codon:yes gene_type:complete